MIRVKSGSTFISNDPRFRKGHWFSRLPRFERLALRQDEHVDEDDIDRGTPKYSDKNVSNYHFVHHISLSRNRNWAPAVRQVTERLRYSKAANHKSESTFLFNAPRLPKSIAFLEGSETSSVCLPGKSNMCMQTSLEHWWNDNNRGKPKYSEKNPSHCHFVHHKPHIELPGFELGSPMWEAGE